jgi:hypothetical protein
VEVVRVSCEKCDAAQDLYKETSGPAYYARVGEANIELVGCRDHLAELVRRLRAYRACEELAVRAESYLAGADLTLEKLDAACDKWRKAAAP